MDSLCPKITDIAISARLAAGCEAEIFLGGLKSVPNRQLVLRRSDKVKEMAASIANEVNVCKTLSTDGKRNPLVGDFLFCIQTNAAIYRAAPFYNGGNLQDVGGYHDLSKACAEVVEAVAHVHSLGYAHRDVKPENILLNGKGHCKLVDFGLCIPVKKDGSTKCFIPGEGTQEWAAPEVWDVPESGYCPMKADWYSVGLALHYMATGKLLKPKEKPSAELPEDLYELVEGLTAFHPEDRLCEAEEIKVQAFFEDIDFHHLREEARTNKPGPVKIQDKTLKQRFPMWRDLKTEDVFGPDAWICDVDEEEVQQFDGEDPDFVGINCVSDLYKNTLLKLAHN